MVSSPFSAPQNPFFVEPNPFGPPSTRENEARPALPMLDASEVESTDRAIEIVIRWGQDILHIEHLDRPRAFTVGEEGSDFVLPAKSLADKRAPIVHVEGDKVFGVVRSGASAKIVVAGRTLELADAIVEKLAEAFEDTVRVPLADGARVKMEMDGFELEVASVNAGKRVAGKRGTDGKAFAGQALSMGIHGAIAAALFAFTPALASTEDAPIDSNQSYMMSLIQHAEQDRVRETEQKQGEADKPAPAPGERAGTEQNGPGQKAGTTTAAPSPRVQRLSVSTSEKERRLDRAEALREAASFGMADLIGTLSSQESTAAPWGSTASGPDADNHLGALWGDDVALAFGPGGLDMSGTGSPSGGRSLGRDVGALSTIYGGDGTCTGPDCGNGNSVGFLPSRHKPSDIRPPRGGNPDVKGRIPAEVIQRIVRQNFGRATACYQAGLRSNPNLSGRVVLNFTIGRDGGVSSVQTGGSDLADASVVSCIAKTFYGLSFPAPEGGVVHVSYPIAFNPL